MMAEAAGAAEKEHGGGEALGDDHGIVASATGHSSTGKASLFGGGLEELRKRWAQWDGGLFKLSLRADVHATLCCSGVCAVRQRGRRELASLVVGMAHVERRRDFSC